MQRIDLQLAMSRDSLEATMNIAGSELFRLTFTAQSYRSLKQ